jgi:predicted small metal-binding protein
VKACAGAHSGSTAGRLVRTVADQWRTTMKTTLACPCGTLIRGDNEDDLVEKAFAHLREKHPDMADEYEREHILFMAY